jgi:hypothetical protein
MIIMKTPANLKPSDPIVLRLASEADCDPRTAFAALEGRSVRARVRRRIEQAAKTLKIALPTVEE